MPTDETSRVETSLTRTSLDVGDDVLARLRAGLGSVADEAVAAIVEQVPSYAGLTGRYGVVLREAVLLALGHFFTLAAQHADAAVPQPFDALTLSQTVVDVARSLERADA